MKLTTFCLIANFEIPELQVGKIKFSPEVQSHIYAKDDGTIGFEHEIADFENITVDGLPCTDFRKLKASYNAMGVDIDTEMDKVTEAYISEHFEEDKYRKLGEHIKAHQGSIDLRKENPHLKETLKCFQEELNLDCKNNDCIQSAQEQTLGKYILLFPNYKSEILEHYNKDK